jgi:hypothetical protein
MLRYCPKCLEVRQAITAEVCRRCDRELLPFLDESGAISRSFLAARGSCCDTGCRNCPYQSIDTKGMGAGSAQDKQCQRCGASFECCGGNGWCANVPLTPATLKWLERSYAGCLCPACLAEFSTAAT